MANEATLGPRARGSAGWSAEQEEQPDSVVLQLSVFMAVKMRSPPIKDPTAAPESRADLQRQWGNRDRTFASESMPNREKTPGQRLAAIELHGATTHWTPASANNSGNGPGGFTRWLAAVARTDVLVLDDWGMTAMDGPTRADLMEIIDDRAGTRATIVTSQLPVEHWHAWIGDATIADAILDRLL